MNLPSLAKTKPPTHDYTPGILPASGIESEPVITTDVSRQIPFSKLRVSPQTPAAFLAADRERMWLAIIVAFLTLVGCICAMAYAISKLTRTQMVFAVDASGTIHSGPLEDVTADGPVFYTSALLATQAAFQRSVITFQGGGEVGKAADYDLPELVKHLFRADAKAKLDDDLKRQAPDLATRHISQKVEVGGFRGLAQRNGNWLVSVKCDLKRSGNFDGQPVSESVPITCIFAFRQNPKLDERGQFPFIVTDFRVLNRNDDSDGANNPSSDSAPAASTTRNP